MRFRETPVAGSYVVEPERMEDARGFFARTFAADEFAARGLDARVDQCSTSFNAKRGTLRGLHYQAAPHGEAKLVRCTRGAIYDVAVDLRPDSESFRRWHGTELTADNGRMFYIPVGMAHGFQTLEDGAEIHYQISVPYVPGAARGVRWDDPAFAIAWPDCPERLVSPRDQGFPDWRG